MTGATQELDLSIVIVNWNSVAFLRECLRTVFETVGRISFEVIVVDNSSGDGCGEMLASEYPAVRFFQSQDNLGFSGANNWGSRHAQGRILLFLNPDTEVLPMAIERMVSFLDATPDAGVVGGLLLNTDRSIQTSCIQRLPTIFNQAVDLEFLRVKFPNLDVWGMRPLFENPASTASVEVISGACLMLRRELFVKVGAFETSYFMYSEDADLCLKALKAGCRNYYLPDAVTIHHGGQSSSVNPQNQFGAIMMRESLFRFFKLRKGSLYAQGYRFSTAIMSCFRLALVGSALLAGVKGARANEARGAAAKWRKVLRWSVGLEGWSKDAGVQPGRAQTT